MRHFPLRCGDPVFAVAVVQDKGKATFPGLEDRGKEHAEKLLHLREAVGKQLRVRGGFVCTGPGRRRFRPVHLCVLISAGSIPQFPPQ
jgi:hypothetical protein